MDALLRRMLEALKEAYQHETDFNAFHSSLKKERPKEVEQWEAELLAWEADQTRPSPYMSAQPSVYFMSAAPI